VIDTELYPDLKISSSEQVIVRAPQHFKDLFKLINVTETRYPDSSVRSKTLLKHQSPEALPLLIWTVSVV